MVTQRVSFQIHWCNIEEIMLIINFLKMGEKEKNCPCKTERHHFFLKFFVLFSLFVYYFNNYLYYEIFSLFFIVFVSDQRGRGRTRGNVGGKFEKKRVGGTKKFEGRKNMGRVRRGFSLGKSDQNAVCVSYKNRKMRIF